MHYGKTFTICITEIATSSPFRVGIERTSGDPMNPYLAATASKPLTVPEEPAEVRTPSAAPSDSDYDST